MANYSVKVNIDAVQKILARHGLQNDGPILSFLTSEVARQCDPYVPADSNQLKNSVLPNTPQVGQIYYKGPYAQIHHKGYIMVDPKYNVGGFYNKATKQWFSRPNVKKVVSNRKFTYKGTPKRGSNWEERMWNDKGKTICKDLEVFIKKYGK
ncbi:MAG: minor capsid protein [Bacilli bacterium]